MQIPTLLHPTELNLAILCLLILTLDFHFRERCGGAFLVAPWLFGEARPSEDPDRQRGRGHHSRPRVTGHSVASRFLGRLCLIQAHVGAEAGGLRAPRGREQSQPPPQAAWWPWKGGRPRRTDGSDITPLLQPDSAEKWCPTPALPPKARSP